MPNKGISERLLKWEYPKMEGSWGQILLIWKERGFDQVLRPLFAALRLDHSSKKVFHGLSEKWKTKKKKMFHQFPLSDINFIHHMFFISFTIIVSSSEFSPSLPRQVTEVSQAILRFGLGTKKQGPWNSSIEILWYMYLCIYIYVYMYICIYQIYV